MLWRDTLRVGGLVASLWWQPVSAITLTDPTNEAQLILANTLAIDNAMTYYTGDEPGNAPGTLPNPYYWWEAGGLFGLLIQRWSITGNSSYNNLVTTGMQFQVGDNKNFEPQNQTKDLGNDDQVFWAFAAMDAAELGFPDPPASDPSWTSLAQAVFNRQTQRYDTQECNGGIRWQIILTNPGWDYKNTMTNGGYFQLAARLARYTGNQTYADYADKVWNWLEDSPIFDNSTGKLTIWDGIHVENCTSPEELDWTYNPGTLLMGAAYMFNYTNGAAIWEQRVKNLLEATDVFFVNSAGANTPPVNAPPGGKIMAEVACEFPATQTCNQDEPSFKSYTSRWLAMTTLMAPFTNATIWPRLQASAMAAATQCTGSGGSLSPGNACGRRWYQTTWDGFFGLGEQMSAMSVFQSLLINNAKAPLTASKGGISVGDPSAGNAGGSDGLIDDPTLTTPITGADKFGAAVLTIMSISLAVGGGVWMIL